MYCLGTWALFRNDFSLHLCYNGLHVFPGQDLLMYLLQLVQALKYENFSDIQGGLEPGSKRESQGLSEDSTLDRSEER